MFLVMPRAALQGKHFDCGDELRRQGGDGVRHRNKGEYYSAVSSTGFVEICGLRLKKEPGPPGCTIYFCLTSPGWWPAIHARMPC